MSAPQLEDAGFLLHSSMGGDVADLGGGRIAFRYPGLFVSGLMVLPVAVWAAGAVAMGIAAITMRDLAPLAGASAGAIAAAGFGGLIRIRWRRMGRFEVDAAAGTLTWWRLGKQRGRWPLDEVVFGSAWDPFHRGFELQYWLVARVPDGRGMRLAKGARSEVQALLERLKGLALRVG